ncbi:MAG: endonuclease/exonuclease/phosphatase family protein [Verrucomicrobia bacterium]|nr:endonuclease/exonuclease/phosphatase family protein [Verrucomicrobiota bacterium]
MARIAVSIVCLWLIGQSLAGEVVRIATYNVRNYLEVDRWSDGRYRKNFPKPEAEKEAARKVLVSVRPDVVVLQEMGVGPYLSELQADLKEEGLDLPYQYVAKGFDADRHVALLSRFEPAEIFTHTDMEFKYFEEIIPVKRGMLEVVFQTRGLKWKVFGLHLKSKWSDYDEDPISDNRRRSEALACRKKILDLQKEDDLPFLVLGDFNDSKSSASVRLLQFRGKTEVAAAVECTDSRGERWTHYYDKEDEYRRVDYILKSPDFPASILGDKGHIHDGAESLVASDHRLVWVDLEWGGEE